jgi:hypothetical protein
VLSKGRFAVRSRVPATDCDLVDLDPSSGLIFERLLHQRGVVSPIRPDLHVVDQLKVILRVRRLTDVGYVATRIRRASFNPVGSVGIMRRLEAVRSDLPLWPWMDLPILVLFLLLFQHPLDQPQHLVLWRLLHQRRTDAAEFLSDDHQGASASSAAIL